MVYNTKKIVVLLIHQTNSTTTHLSTTKDLEISEFKVHVGQLSTNFSERKCDSENQVLIVMLLFLLKTQLHLTTNCLMQAPKHILHAH